MKATTKRAGTLIPGDLIHVKHHEHDGPPCRGDWSLDAIVDEVDAARVTCDKIAVVGWHDADHPNCCGVMVVGAGVKVPYLGHLRAAA